MGKKGRGGKKKSTGDRFPGGRLKPMRDYGSERTVELRMRFRAFRDGKADHWVGTPIGRAWIVGLMEGHDIDSAVIRDAGVAYAQLYWSHYPAPSAVANYEAMDRRGAQVGNDRRSILFTAMDAAILSAGRDSRDAVHNLVIDCHWLPDENPAWLDRLINLNMIRARQPAVGQLPTDADRARLDLAVQGLLAITAGTGSRPIRSAA